MRTPSNKLQPFCSSLASFLDLPLKWQDPLKPSTSPHLTSMGRLFRSRRSESTSEPSPRGLGKLFSKLRNRRRGSDASSSSSSFSSSFSDSDWEDGPVRMLRPRDTIVTSIDSTSSSESMLLSPRSRRAEQRRSGARACM